MRLKKHQMQAANDEPTSVVLRDFEEWMQWSSTHYSKSSSARHSTQPFMAQVSAWSYGPLELSKASFLEDETANYMRGPAEIREDPRDHIELLSLVQGAAQLEQGGRCSRLAAGDSVIYEQAKPFSLQFHGECETIFLNVPNARVLRRWPDVGRATAVRVDGASRIGCFVGALLRDLAKLDIDASTAGYVDLGHAATDTILASLELGLRGHVTDAGGDTRLLAQTKRFILANLCDPDLAIEDIVKAQNISRSTLNRLFAAEATTPMKWIWHQRLAACHEALADGRVRQITALAFDHGFNDLSHFSRSFKKVYGHSPSSMLRA